MHKQLHYTLKEKENMKKRHMTPLIEKLHYSLVSSLLVSYSPTLSCHPDLVELRLSNCFSVRTVGVIVVLSVCMMLWCVNTLFVHWSGCRWLSRRWQQQAWSWRTSPSSTGSGKRWAERRRGTQEVGSAFGWSHTHSSSLSISRSLSPALLLCLYLCLQEKKNTQKMEVCKEGGCR